MPGHCRPSARTASRRKARSPQWKSWTGAVKNSRPSAVSIGLPIQRCFQGIAPGRMRPPPDGQAAAHHQVGAGAQRGEEPRQRAEIVGAVRVAHQHEPATRRGDPAGQGVAVAAAGHVDHTRAGRRGQGRRAVACCHCRRPRTSPATPAAASAASASRTQAARVSASFRHGIRIETSSAARADAPPARTGRSSSIADALPQLASAPHLGRAEIKRARRGCHPPRQAL